MNVILWLTLAAVMVWGSTQAVAQDRSAAIVGAQPLPEGGALLLDATALRPFVNSGTATVEPVNGGFVGRVTERGRAMWDIGISARTPVAVARDDVLGLEVVASGRGALSPEGYVNLVFELAGPPHTKSLDVTVSVAAERRRFVFGFKSLADFPPEGSQLSIRFGDVQQEIRIESVRLINYGKSKSLDDLPRTVLNYPGMEDDAPWRAEALARIEKLRKADLSVEVVDATGRPVPGAEVKVEMTRHEYRFGTAVPAARLLGTSTDDETFRQTLLRLFNYATLENDLKWPEYLREPERAHRAVAWLRERGLEVRGHTLIWPGWNPGYLVPASIRERFLEMKQTDVEAARKFLREACAERVLTATRALAGQIRDWDVINETYANHDIMDELGREIMVEWFKLARQGDPNAVLYLNDYGILEGGGRDQRHIDHFFNDAKFILDNGGPIGGIGIQGHWGSTLTSPVKMLEILDRFATLGLPIQITEFDINIDDEQAQALFTRDALITIFSHPSTDAFIKWGFWERSHWLPRSAMFRADWSKKPNAHVWEEWVLGRWWTRESLTTAADGTAAVRGFKGTYRLTVTTPDGRTTTLENVKLSEGGQRVRIEVR